MQRSSTSLGFTSRLPVAMPPQKNAGFLNPEADPLFAREPQVYRSQLLLSLNAIRGAEQSEEKSHLIILESWTTTERARQLVYCENLSNNPEDVRADQIDFWLGFA